MNVGETRPGRRIRSVENFTDLRPGDYGPLGKQPENWALYPPGGNYGHISTRVHNVVEHEDGTITVTPSILQHRGEGKPDWHGFLERGVWRRV